jgi:hypothetical protein
MIIATALALASVAILGVRADATAQLTNTWFFARATATLLIVLGAAIVAFSISVPGAEPSLPVRALPLAASLMWAVMLAGAIAATWSAGDLVQVTPHPSCVLIIAATALSPAVMLVRMLRHAAPLRAARTAAFAGLASLAMGALGAQFVCTNDAAAHHLLWHFTPVMVFTLASAAAGSSVLGWPHRRPF